MAGETAISYVPNEKRYGRVEFRRCGQSGLALPPISLGTWQNFGGINVFETCRAMVRRAFDRAVTHFDLATETAEFAAAHGNFWEMHDLLYENQENLEDESLFGLAVAVGLSPDKLGRSLEAGIYRDRIDNDFRGGVRSGVNGTPTFFIKVGVTTVPSISTAS
jgi:2-hydroxychromene-2-carboxylate isomerase